MTLNQARREGNKLMVSYNIWNTAKRDRKYPELEIDDNVRVLMRKPNKTKGTYPKNNVKVYKVITIRGNDYMVNDGKCKVYQRFELLEV